MPDIFTQLGPHSCRWTGVAAVLSIGHRHKKISNKIKENDSKIPQIHILLTNVHLDCRGKFPVTGNASRDDSAEIGDKSVETKDKYIEAGEKTQQTCYDHKQRPSTPVMICS